MTVKAMCVLNGSIGRYFQDHTKFYVGFNYAALDDSDPPIAGTTYLYGLTPGSGTFKADAEAALKTFLEGEGVVFDVGDTVELLL